MDIKKTLVLTVSVCSMFSSMLAQEPAEGNPFIVRNKKATSGNVYTSQPMPEVQMETELILEIGDNPRKARTASVTIYKNGMQRYKFQNGTFFYVMPESKINSFTGEKEIDYNYRITQNRPKAYLPEIIGTLAYMKNNKETSEIYRSRDGVVFHKYVCPEYELLMRVDDTQEGILADIPLCFTRFEPVRGGLLEGSRLTVKGVSYPDYQGKYTYNYLTVDRWKRPESSIMRTLDSFTKLGPLVQHVESNGYERDFVVAPGDSITAIENMGNYVIAQYSDGGYVKYSMMPGKEWVAFEANLKKDNNMVGCFLIDAAGKPVQVVKYTDGPYKDYYIRWPNIFSTKSIRFDPEYDYQIIDAAFNYVSSIINGKTAEERRLEKIAIQEIYRNECAKYGKSWVDNAIGRRLSVGTPESLLTAYYDHKVKSRSKGITVYEVIIDEPYADFEKKIYTSRGHNHKHKNAYGAIVYVSNKKVTKVKYVPLDY